MTNFSTTQDAIWPLAAELDGDFSKNVKDIKVYTLANGLRVLQTSDEKDRSFRVKIMVNAGAIHQNINKRGLPHFHEHMVFKGTKSFPTKKSMHEFSEDFNLDHNAYTGDISQGFHATADSDKESAAAACKYVSEVVFNPLFPEKEIEVEKQVVLSERKMYNNDPWSVLYETYDQHFYGDSNPLGGGGVLGSEQDILSFSHQDVLDHHHQLFHPANMILVLSSGLSHKVMQELAEHYFNVESENGAWVVNSLKDLRRPENVGDFHLEKDLDATYLTVTNYFSADEIKFPDLDYFALSVVSYILDRRIYKDLRDNQGMAYAIGAYSNNTYHGQNLVMYGQFADDHVQSAIDQLKAYPQKLLDKPITAQEFTRAMRNKKSIRWASSPKKILDHVASRYFYYGQFVSPEYTQKYFDQLSIEYINNFVSNSLVTKPAEVISVGPSIS